MIQLRVIKQFWGHLRPVKTSQVIPQIKPLTTAHKLAVNRHNNILFSVGFVETDVGVAGVFLPLTFEPAHFTYHCFILTTNINNIILEPI